jgi:hypothetical protein
VGGSAALAVIALIFRPKIGAAACVVAGLLAIGFELVETVPVGFTLVTDGPGQVGPRFSNRTVVTIAALESPLDSAATSVDARFAPIRLRPRVRLLRTIATVLHGGRTTIT